MKTTKNLVMKCNEMKSNESEINRDKLVIEFMY